MAYNKNTSVNNILTFKKWWQDADKAGDDAGRQYAAGEAAKEYEQLRKNGYSDIADILGTSDYTAAKKWATGGKTKTRDFVSSLGKAYGMSDDEVNKIISYDDLTGDIFIGGKNIGNADVVVDGTSYWGDTSKLKSEFDDYISRSGTTRSNEAAVAQENESLFKKYTQEYEDLKNTNPFTTAEAKAILAKYDLAGLQGRDNAVASGSATNGGNIDSYAAANAMRQQAALVNQGQMAVLDAHQQKLDHARALLSDMGVNIDRVFNQGETAKNNEVARKSEIASVTGTVPTEWTYDNNIYLNSDGTVRDEYLTDEFDNTGGFTTIINNAKEKLKTTTDEGERAKLQATINAATQAKALKTFSSPKYAPYAHEVEAIAPNPTEAARQFNETMDYNNKLLQSEVDLATGGAVKATAYPSGGYSKSASGGNTQELSKLTMDKGISQWLYSPYGTDGVGSSYRGYDGTQHVQYIAAEKLNEFESDIKFKLVQAGYTEIQAKNKINEYKDNIAVEIAKIEGKDYNDKDVIDEVKKEYHLEYIK